MFLIATKINTYRDGGTIEVKYDNKSYFIDRRIGTATPNAVYDAYPSEKTATRITDPELILEILEVLKK